MRGEETNTGLSPGIQKGTRFLANGTEIPSGEAIIGPSGNYVTYYADKPESTSATQIWSGEICVDGICLSGSHTSTVTKTAYPPTSGTSSQLYGQDTVVWDSTATTNANPSISSYTYGFLFGVIVPEGQQPEVAVSLVGKFYYP